MNYRHAFHAGNFADVHKHVILLALLEHLHKKASPFFVLDTHAGRGLYDLQSAEAVRGAEWRQGVGRLRDAKDLPTAFSKLLQFNRDVNEYWGSPLVAASMLRENDRAVFVERQPEEAAALSKSLGKRKHVSVLAEDGYSTLRAQLPPKENRGVVLVDPPYERETEFVDVARALTTALARWPNGIYCVWYPIKSSGAERRLLSLLIDAKIRKMLLSELSIRPTDSPLALNGSGMLIVNPPWQLDAQLQVLVPQLHEILSPDGTGATRTEWLTPE